MPSDIYTQMTERIMLVGSKIIPQLFKMIADEDEARLLMAMPGIPVDLAAKVDRPLETVAAMCDTLYRKGLAFKSFKGETIGYKMCNGIIQFHDASILWPEAPKAFFDLWQRFMEEEWPHFARQMEQSLPKPFTRVIPVEKSVDPGRQRILDADSASTIIANAQILAVTECTCRKIAHKCDKPLEVCLQVNNAARYTLDRGTGREISKDEALAILKATEDVGLVHVTMNKAHVGHFICNCCPCCCQALPLVITENVNICDPSRYQASIDPEVCSFCGTCLERCYFNALEEAENAAGDAVMRVVQDRCMGCGLCQVTCPDEAITLVEARPEGFIPQ